MQSSRRRSIGLKKQAWFLSAMGLTVACGGISDREKFLASGPKEADAGADEAGESPKQEPRDEDGGRKKPDPFEMDGAVGAGPVLTYYQHTKPIFDNKCLLCHVEGGPAPMALDTYEAVKEWAPAILLAVASGQMPPWYAEPDCNEYIGDRSLTEKQVEQVVGWASGGALEGDPKKEADPIPAEPNNFRADVTLTMAEEYTPSIVPDEYRCFIMPWPEDEATFITGVGLKPGNKQMVHHSVVYIVGPDVLPSYRDRDAADPGPGYTCFTGTGGEVGAQLVGAIEKAEAGRSFPEGTGLRVEPGSAIIIQQHYNTLITGKPEPDQSSLEFTVDANVPSPASTTWWMNALWIAGIGMDIPANDPNVTVSYSGAVNSPMLLHWADLHMHTLGTGGELSVIHADGSRECLLKIDDWAFEWQETYMFRRPVVVQPGDQIYLECRWDNTAENQFIVNGERLPPQDVRWGDGSRDEMCLGNFLTSPLD